VAELEYDPKADDSASLFDELKRSRADVVLAWSDARSSAALLQSMRAAGLSQLFVGSEEIVNSEFIDLAGADAGQVLAFARCPHFAVSGDTAPSDADALRDLLGVSRSRPSPHASRSFDAAVHLMAAIELAGAEPEAVRGALCEMNAVTLARLTNGAWSFSRLDSP
jgi:ABC-type branched-subunit amino acid transport system substrate-binding protein